MSKNKPFNAFLCHSFTDAKFVIEVAKHLKRNFNNIFYFEEGQKSDEPFDLTIDTNLKNSQVMIVFIGKKLTIYQEYEIEKAIELKMTHFVNIFLPGSSHIVPSLIRIQKYPMFRIKDFSQDAIFKVANDIVSRVLKEPLKSIDGLPFNPHLFSYEKDIIKFFIKKIQFGDEIYARRIPDKIPKEKYDKLLENLKVEKDIDLLKKVYKVSVSTKDYKIENSIEEPDMDKLWEILYINGIIKNIDEKEKESIRQKLLNGCPSEWPTIIHWQDYKNKNKINQDDIGKWRPENARVIAAALSDYHCNADIGANINNGCMILNKIIFPEAGPREYLYYPLSQKHRNFKVAILVSGGIAPGINAVIDGITQRHSMYTSATSFATDVYGFKNGFYAFDSLDESFVMLKKASPGGPNDIVTSDHASEAGSILGTSRVETLLNTETRFFELDKIVSQLYNWNIDILYIIGGDGSMRAAHAIWNYAKEYAAERNSRHRLSVIAIPKTMDNDILWVWQTFGFLSAVEKSREIIDNLSSEIKSNPRLGIAQLFGSDSGFVVSHAVLASKTGICDAALIPEVDFSLKKLAKYLKEKMCNRSERIPYGLIVMAETAIPIDAIDYLKDDDIGLSPTEAKAVEEYHELRIQGNRIQGQTDDSLRTAGLKIVSRGLLKLLPTINITKTGSQPDWSKLRVLTNEPRHLLRAIPPSSSDIIMGHRLGTLAVDNAMAGYTDFMISQWLTEYVLVPLDLVVLGRKRIPKTGVFWKSVLAKTGQYENMI